MADTIADILKDVNEKPSEVKKYIGNNYLRNLMEAAFLEDKKMYLPEGDPPFKESGIDAQQAKGVFWQVCRKLPIFNRQDISPFKRESQFIFSLESLDKESAKILLAVKDQNLTSIYPNITLESLKEQGYFK